MDKITARRTLGPLLPVAAFFALAIAVLALTRAAWVAWQWDRVDAVHGLAKVFAIGLRMDTVLLCYVLFIPAVMALLMPTQGRLARPWRNALCAGLALLAATLVFLELATPSYIDQFGVRPSRIFVEYLVHPREVLATLWGAYPFTLLAGVVLFGVTALLAWKGARRLADSARPWSWQRRALALPLVILAIAAGARSSLDHRPANPSTAAFSSDPLVNDLAMSSGYTVLNAAYAMRRDVDASAVYGRMAAQEIVSHTRAAMITAGSDFRDLAIPTAHRQQASAATARPLNLVIILEESLGAQFVGSLGGLDLTPELDRLSKEGIWLTQLYATGTRSARGLEGVVTGFPPTPAQSVLKLGKSQDGFYTLARTLAGQGFATDFIYGGESGFDNMAAFFLRNGFQRVIDQRDYPQPRFRGTWGVSDEDLFDRAHQEFVAHGEKPFFAVVFTSSFHSPFEFPDGRIDLYEQPKATANNAVKYADFALGQFFSKAKAARYWENTIFLVVADHDSRVFGASLVPIERFHIPGLILGKSVPSGRYTRPASQIDLAPTLLSLIGVSAVHPMIGHDLTRVPPDFPGRAIMQYENNNAYLKGSHVVIQEPNKQPRQFQLDKGRLGEAEALDGALAREALAHALWPSLAYRQGTYRAD